MSTPTTDVPATDPTVAAVPPPLQESTAPGAKVPKVLPTTCFICKKDLEHSEVVLLGQSDADADIAVHPNCLMPGVNDGIKNLNLIHVHTTPKTRISPAKMIVVKKNIRAIYRAIALANARKQAETRS